MKVTICIPCYQQAEYLSDAIDSALHQTYKDIEIIVVNDGSPDHTKEIAERYAAVHTNIRVINQVNKGLAAARNAAIMSMRGQYFLPLDADDILLEGCVKELVRVAKNTKADVIAPSFKTFGLATEQVILMASPSIEDFRTANRIGYFSMIKRSALQEVGGYSSRMFAYEDWALWFDLLSRGKTIVTVPQPLVLYRTKKESMWTDAVKNHHKELMEQIYKDYASVWPK